MDFDTEAVKFGSKWYCGINPETGKKETFIFFSYKRDIFEFDFFIDRHYDWEVNDSGAGTKDHFYLPEVMEDFVYDAHPYFHSLLPLLPENDIV